MKKIVLAFLFTLRLCDVAVSQTNFNVSLRLDFSSVDALMELSEGKNRQVRRMTAAVGFPTLRLVRVRMGKLSGESVKQGTWMELGTAEIAKIWQR